MPLAGRGPGALLPMMALGGVLILASTKPAFSVYHPVLVCLLHVELIPSICVSGLSRPPMRRVRLLQTSVESRRPARQALELGLWLAL